MPLRLSAFLLIALAAGTGCTTQRDAADLDSAPDTTATVEDSTAIIEDSTVTPEEPGGGMPPNIAVYLDGTWDLTLVPRESGERITGTWTIHEGGENRLATSAGIDAPVRVGERMVTGDAFFVTGVVERGEGPAAFEAGGTLRGNEMTGEVTIEGLGTFGLTGARRTD